MEERRSHSAHHGHHRRHHHGKLYRLRRYIRHNKKLIAGTAGICACVLLICGVLLSQSIQKQEQLRVTAGNSVDMKSGYRNLTYNGKKYQYNELVTTVLYAGLDSEGTIGTTGYSKAPRADSINLVVLDKKNKKMTILAISRDTMTDIRRYTLSGKDRGTYKSHLGLAYTYGDGGEVSCENLREAVSNLLGGVPVADYLVMNRSSLPAVNELVGGVTVTVPNDELADQFPEFQKGAVVTLDAATVEPYLRQRDTAQDFSNEGRMERQRSYMTAYAQQLQTLLKEDINAAWQQLDSVEDSVQTSITRNKYLSYAKFFNSVPIDEGCYARLPGTDQLGNLHDEFHVDEDALQELILELFYEEI